MSIKKIISVFLVLGVVVITPSAVLATTTSATTSTSTAEIKAELESLFKELQRLVDLVTKYNKQTNNLGLNNPSRNSSSGSGSGSSGGGKSGGSSDLGSKLGDLLKQMKSKFGGGNAGGSLGGGNPSGNIGGGNIGGSLGGGVIPPIGGQQPETVRKMFNTGKITNIIECEKLIESNYYTDASSGNKTGFYFEIEAQVKDANTSSNQAEVEKVIFQNGESIYSIDGKEDPAKDDGSTRKQMTMEIAEKLKDQPGGVWYWQAKPEKQVECKPKNILFQGPEAKQLVGSVLIRITGKDTLAPSVPDTIKPGNTLDVSQPADQLTPVAPAQQVIPAGGCSGGQCSAF